MRTHALAIVALLALGTVDIAPAVAQGKPEKADQTAAPQRARSITLAPVTTDHRLALPGGTLDYRAVVETLPVVDDKGATTAQVAVIAYLAAAADPESRPVTFVFNGGPGVSSAFLQLGALGPKVLVTGEGGAVPAPPARLRDNPDSWLAFTDLVFVDPVGTGFSRPTKTSDDAEKPFWSVSGDTRSLAEIIRLWLTRNARWPSPKFIAGESYGGFRGAQIARRLLDDQGVALNGLVMISPALEFSTISPGRYSALPWALALPSMVASARAQGKGDAAMPLDAVEQFALTDYLTGIAAIAPAGPGPAPSLIDEVSKLLGLEEETVRRYHGRVPVDVFAEQLLKGTGLSLSLYDGAFAGPDPRPGRPGADPLLGAIKAPLSAAYNAYVRDDLKVETDVPFLLLNQDTSRNWDWEGARGGRGGGAMDEVAQSLALTPGLRLLVVHGRTDLVTPYMASRWLLDRLDLPDDVRSRVDLTVLDGGHMMYLAADQRRALSERAAEFYRR
jgi:carboxypeptidase C (cathepsin A)